MENIKLIVIAEFSNSMDAHLARLALENEGIEAFVEGELLPHPGILSEMNVSEVWVKSEDTARAKEILESQPASALDDDVQLDDSEPFDCEDEEGGGDEGTVNE